MIEWEQRSNTEAVSAIITNINELFNDDSSSYDGSMPKLQERTREDSSSSDGSAMPHLASIVQEDSSSDKDTGSQNENEI